VQSSHVPPIQCSSIHVGTPHNDLRERWPGACVTGHAPFAATRIDVYHPQHPGTKGTAGSLGGGEDGSET